MLAEKAIKMASQLVILILLSRVLGPIDMGNIMFCFALSSMFVFLNGLGLDTLLVKKIIERPKKSNSYLKHALIARIGAACACVILVNFVGLWVVEDASRELLLVISMYHLFMPFTVFEWFFQSKGRGDLSALGLVCGHLVGFVCRLGVLYFGGGLVWLGAAYVLEMFVMALVYSLIAWRSKFKFQGPFSISRASNLVVEAAPLILAGAVVLLYMKVDQIMLGYMKGAAEVGIYVAASRLSEAWYFVGLTLIGVYFPKLLQIYRGCGEEAYDLAIVRMGRWLVWGSVGLAGITGYFSEWLIGVLYGVEFFEAANVLLITIWCVPFVYLGTISTKMHVVCNNSKIILWRGLVGLALNLVLNIFLIRGYGALGAGISTLVAQIFSGLVFNYFSPSKSVFKVQAKILFIGRYSLANYKKNVS